MKRYKIKKIYTTIQDRGRWSGKAVICVQFAFKRSSGVLLSLTDILLEVITQSDTIKHVVLMGDEPTTQVDQYLVDALHEDGYYVAIETDGSKQYPWNVDWVTLLTDRAHASCIVIAVADELIYRYRVNEEFKEANVRVYHHFIASTLRTRENENACIEFVKSRSEYQITKIINRK